jgi:hypothetical protein
LACYAGASEITGGEKSEAIMFARMTADGRLLGLDIGEWSMLFGGCMLAGLLAHLV